MNGNQFLSFNKPRDPCVDIRLRFTLLTNCVASNGMMNG
jgi:hypothetical protein